METQQAYKALFAVLIVTLLSVVGIALPYPILAPLFLAPEHTSLNHFLSIDGKLLLALLLTAYPLGMLIGSSFIGSLSDHYGRKKTLLVSSLLSSLGYGISALAIINLNFPLLLLARFLTGLCEGNIAIGRAIATDLHPTIDKTRSFSWIYAVSYSGWLIGPMIGGYTVSWGPHVAFIIAGISSTLSCLAVGLWIQETEQKSEKKAASLLNVLQLSLKQNSFLLLKDTQIRPVFFMYLLLTLGLNAFYQYFPVWLVEDFNYGSTEIAHATALQTAFMVLFTLAVVERMKKRMGLQNTIFIGLSLLICALGSIHLVPTWAVLAYFAITGSAIALYNGLVPVLISDTFASEKQGRLMGLLISTFSLASVLIAPLGGVISLLGAKITIVTGALLLFSGGIYLKLIINRNAQDESEMQSESV